MIERDLAVFRYQNRDHSELEIIPTPSMDFLQLANGASLLRSTEDLSPRSPLPRSAASTQALMAANCWGAVDDFIFEDDVEEEGRDSGGRRLNKPGRGYHSIDPMMNTVPAVQ